MSHLDLCAKPAPEKGYTIIASGLARLSGVRMHQRYEKARQSPHQVLKIPCRNGVGRNNFNCFRQSVF